MRGAGGGGIKTERDTSWCMREREGEGYNTDTEQRTGRENRQGQSRQVPGGHLPSLSPVNNQHASNASLSDI